ncbi:MAG TPA: hypothetical protein VFA59_03020 [Vicinamibacterales bacterium]|nr:hypothetical protein [Vicinamibacterales bacterium]
MKSIAAAVVASLVLLGTAGLLQAQRERAFPPTDTPDDEVLIASPTALRRMTVGFNALAADVYWIRALQYYGGTKRRLAARAPAPQPPHALAGTSDYDRLYDLLNLTTSLDPLFDIAYRFGAVFLAEPYPLGPDRPDLAVKLLEKGMQARPERWQYLEDIGFVHYWYERNYKAAADAFARAGDISGAPNWLKPLAATTLAQGGDRRTSRAMWLAILQSADVDWLRHQAEWRLQQFRALDDIDVLQARVDAYTKRTGTVPRDWQSLVAAGDLRRIPTDPTGVAYELGPGGRVRLSSSSSLLPLPVEPQRLPAATP